MPLEITTDPAQRIGIIGSNSSTASLSVDLIGEHRSRPVNGRLVLVNTTDYEGQSEYGIGTVTEITTTNTAHEDPNLRGVIAIQGAIGGLTGRGDIKAAKVEMQSAFRAVDDSHLRAIGGSLSFAPSTGEPVYLADSASVRSLCEQATKDLYYLGNIYRQDIALPLSFHDFSDARGAEMVAFLGPSGSGKTYLATSFVASQMRHERMAFLLIDPQGQFTTNSKVKRDLPLDLRALGDAQGRDVQQISVAREVRLPEDPELLCDLLAGAGFFGSNRLIGANNQAGNAQDVMEAFLEATPGWSDKEPGELLDLLLAHFVDRVAADAIVVSKGPKERMTANLSEALSEKTAGGQARRKALQRALAPFLNMFGATGPDGAPRRQMEELVATLCSTDIGYAGNRKARPFYVLTLADPKSSGDDELARALGKTKTQMVILRTLFTALEEEARRLYQSEDETPANLMVVMDEAARFTSDSHKDPEQRAMASEMARRFREVRKYATGFTLILQEPSALHDSIWKQLQNGSRFIAGGMVGNDLDRVREQVGNSGALRLYQQLARPSKDNQVYPWMLCGNVSPLSVTATPLFMEAFVSAEAWQAQNKAWLPGMFHVSDIWAGPSA